MGVCDAGRDSIGGPVFDATPKEPEISGFAESAGNAISNRLEDEAQSREPRATGRAIHRLMRAFDPGAVISSPRYAIRPGGRHGSLVAEGAE